MTPAAGAARHPRHDRRRSRHRELRREHHRRAAEPRAAGGAGRSSHDRGHGLRSRRRDVGDADHGRAGNAGHIGCERAGEGVAGRVAARRPPGGVPGLGVRTPESLLQLAWVLGGAIGVLVYTELWVGFTAISSLLVLGLAQTIFSFGVSR